MKKPVIKIISLIVTFILSVVIMEILVNDTTQDMTGVMADASLPMIYMEQDGSRVNALYGYTQEMDPIFTRDTITPLPSTLSLPIQIDTYGEEVTGISYEVRTLDSTRLIEETTVQDFSNKDGVIYATLPVQNLLDAGVEYQMVIELKLEKEKVYYYTRLILPEGMHPEECTEFVKGFHEKTFDKTMMQALAKYMEPNANNANNDLSYVNIHSSASQLFWADFNPTVVSDLDISIKEVKKEYSVFILNYTVSAKDENKQTDYYNVNEYYRVRYGSERMYLIDFERSLEEIYQENQKNFTSTSINLGIRNENVNYVSNETGSCVGFVQQGDLWEFNANNDSIIKVFSFRKGMEFDMRENNNQHGIRVIRVDETGSMDYIVYGYMNRGIHEGKVGISVQRYDSISNASEEVVWIPYTKSYQMMDEIVGKVMYGNDYNEFYIMTEGIVYKIDMLTKQATVLGKGTGEEWLKEAEDSSAIAYVEGENPFAATAIHYHNLKTGKEQEIQAGEGEFIRPLGFVGTDLIYGLAKQNQVTTGKTGVIQFPMYKLVIVGIDGTLRKEYEKKDIYVNDITTDDYTITLNRTKFQNGSYVGIGEDTIMNMAGDEDEVVVISKTISEKKQTCVCLDLSMEIKDLEPNFLAAKLVEYNDDRTLNLESNSEENYYYAYAKGKVVLISANVAEAVKEAAQQTGVVINSSGQYVWQQAKSTSVQTLSGMKADTSKVSTDYTERVLSVILKREGVTISVGELLDNGRTAKQIMTDSLSNASVLDLTGLSLDQMYYYISQGYPVYAMINGNKPVLICGYNSSSVVLYDPSTNMTVSKDADAVKEQLTKAGNIFLAYVMEENH